MTEKLLLLNHRLCRCRVLIVILMLVKYRLYRCSVVIEMFFLANYGLCRCSVVIEKLLLSNHRLCRCSVLIEMSLLANYRLCRCRLVIGIFANKIDIIASSEILWTFTKSHHQFLKYLPAQDSILLVLQYVKSM